VSLSGDRAGKFVLTATGRGPKARHRYPKPFVYGKATATINAAGTVKLIVHATGKDKQELRKFKTLRVSLVIVFTTTTGDQTITHKATVKLKAPQK
jgi:hypothetical protein